MGLYLAALLEEKGLRVDLLERGAAADPERHEGLIHLGGLSEPGGLDEALDVILDAQAAARRMAPRLGGTAGGLFALVCDRGDGRLGRSHEIEPIRAPLGGLEGLARVALREWPRASVRLIDIAAARQPVEVAHALARELSRGGDDLAVALDDEDRRLVLEGDPLAPSDDPPLPRELPLLMGPGAVILVALAGEAPTAALEALARQSRGAHLLLLGGEARAETVAVLEATGARAQALAVAPQDVVELLDALFEVRRALGAITGVIWAGGPSPVPHRLTALPEERAAQVLGQRAGAFTALMAATAGDPMRLLVVVQESAAALPVEFGPRDVGQSAEVSAAAALEAMARAEKERRGEDCQVFVLAPWMLEAAS